MKVEQITNRRVLQRRVQGIAAALLPYDGRGRIATEEFQRHLVATHRAGLMNAVNMDTGYVNYLSDIEQDQVLQWTREALGPDVTFVAGAYIENRAGDVVLLYRRRMDAIVASGGFLYCSRRRACTEKPTATKSPLIAKHAGAIAKCWLLSSAECSQPMVNLSAKRCCVASWKFQS